MLRLVPSLSFSLLVVLLICSLATDAASVSFPNGDLNSSSFNSTTNADFSSGFVTLNGSTALSEILYKDPFALIDPSSSAAISFNTFFTVAANSTSANGTFGFVIVPDSTPGDTYNGTNTFLVEFDNTCYSNSSAQSYGGGQRGPGRGGGSPGGGFRGHNGFSNPSVTNVAVYANGQQILSDTNLSSYNQGQGWNGSGPGWNGSYQDPPYSPWPSSCVQPSLSSLYAYQLVVQYNASAKQVTVALGSACAFGGQIVFPQDLSNVFTPNSMYAGFIASNGAVYNLSQWNFTTNATSTLLSTVVAASTSPIAAPNASPSASNSKISKAYVMAFTLLGGSIAVATLVGGSFL